MPAALREESRVSVPQAGVLASSRQEVVSSS
jgi:hypothetical protein